MKLHIIFFVTDSLRRISWQIKGRPKDSIFKFLSERFCRNFLCCHWHKHSTCIHIKSDDVSSSSSSLEFRAWIGFRQRTWKGKKSEVNYALKIFRHVFFLLRPKSRAINCLSSAINNWSTKTVFCLLQAMMKSRHALKVKVKQHEVNKQTHPFRCLKAAIKRQENFQLTLTEERWKHTKKRPVEKKISNFKRIDGVKNIS